MKKFGRWLGQPRGSSPLCVDDDDDWEAMKSPDADVILCHDEDCNIPVRPALSSKRTRFLRFNPGRECTHQFLKDVGGGPEGSKHKWIVRRLARVIERIGYQALVEDRGSYADVLVPEVGYAIEVQRWPTKFEHRSEARAARGLKTIWLLTADAAGGRGSRSVRNALFGSPAARVTVVDRANRRERLEPWAHSGQGRDAVLQVFATINVPDPADPARLRTHSYDGFRFLSEVLASERLWYPPGTPALALDHAGGWARPLELYRAMGAMPAMRAWLRSPYTPTPPGGND